jgi:hypothetical protein
MANGENVKIVQELMGHANCRCTLEIYSQPRIQAKREAQRRVVEMIVPREPDSAPDSMAHGLVASLDSALCHWRANSCGWLRLRPTRSHSSKKPPLRSRRDKWNPPCRPCSSGEQTRLVR